MQKAVIDRIVDGGRVILLIGEEEKEEIVLIEDLPSGAAEGTWLKIYPNGKMEIDYESNGIRSWL